MVVTPAHGSHHEHHGQWARERQEKGQNAAQPDAQQRQKENANEHDAAPCHHQPGMLSHFHTATSSSI
jgi:hypothetical protein